MQIHVVKLGDTIFTIAKQYNVSAADLIKSNELQNPRNLVIGQTIVIPIYGSYHWVKQGETIESISKEYNIPANIISEINNIYNPMSLKEGMRIYIPQKARPIKDIGTYIDPAITREDSVDEINKVGQYLTYISLFI